MIVPQDVDNLYVVGRCASMTQWGQSSARVTGPCFVMGQAAGTAADLALSATAPPSGIDVSALQQRLTAEGAYLGTDLAPDDQRPGVGRAQPSEPPRKETAE